MEEEMATKKTRGRKPIWGGSISIDALAGAVGVHRNTIRRWITSEKWISTGRAVQPGGKKGAIRIAREFVVERFGIAAAHKADRLMVEAGKANA